MSSREASIATRRFGLGARPGDLARIAADPRGWVAMALARPDAALIDDPILVSSAANFSALQDSQFAEQIARQMTKEMTKETGPAIGPAASAPQQVAPTAPSSKAAPLGVKPVSMQAPPAPGAVRRDVFIEEAAARLARATSTDQPLLERLVMFWSNHFCVSMLKGGGVRVMAGSFEREAIRPHVLGRFSDMLKAVEQHPAMLMYLDNVQSIGPNSQAGRTRNKGLNENLARETMELHTLGVGGYTQTDVTNFAKLITGWGMTDARMIVAAERRGRRLPGATPGTSSTDILPGQFAFFAQRHEPGDHVVLGKTYPDKGLASGEAALNDFARHPATAKYLSTKLASHFVSRSPPPALVARLEKTFRDSGGDLSAVVRTLVASNECWELPAKKVVPPYDFTVALMRAFKIELPTPEALRIAAAIGQPLWQPPSPKGWPDDDDAWMGPSAVRERLRIAERSLQIVDRQIDPRTVARDLFGDAVSETTTKAIAFAESREQGLELLMMSPEFLRR